MTSPSGFSTIDCAWNEADAGVVQILHHLIGRRRRRRHSHPIGLFFLGFCFTESGFVSTAAEEEEEEEEEEENALRLVRDSFLIRACRRRRPPFSRAATGERRGRVCGTCAIAKSFVCFFLATNNRTKKTQKQQQQQHRRRFLLEGGAAKRLPPPRNATPLTVRRFAFVFPATHTHTHTKATTTTTTKRIDRSETQVSLNYFGGGS